MGLRNGYDSVKKLLTPHYFMHIIEMMFSCKICDQYRGNPVGCMMKDASVPGISAFYERKKLLIVI